MDIKVPELGESITSATVAEWLKNVGDVINQDEPVLVLETDKVSVEVPSPIHAVLDKQCVDIDEEVTVGEIIAHITPSDKKVTSEPKASTSVASTNETAEKKQEEAPKAMPAARKLMAEKGVTHHDIGQGSGKGGRITKEDVHNFNPDASKQSQKTPSFEKVTLRDGEERVPMTRLRQTIAKRLKESQDRAAMLTTFNEVDMSAAMALRKKFQEEFVAKYGFKLGYMSIFSKAVIAALEEFPTINAQIDGTDIIYRNFVNLGIAVGGANGLVVPVLRHAEAMSFADIERSIGSMAKAARGGSLKLDQLMGGTFTITNGGIYGSLLSTPILNPPQSGILGMHAIQNRPVAVNGEVVIRPMMYIALSYDHRIVDGKEAVSFLVSVKRNVEDPRRMLINI